LCAPEDWNKIKDFQLEDYFKKLQETPMADDKDMVNSPSHYTQGNIEHHQ